MPGMSEIAACPPSLTTDDSSALPFPTSSPSWVTDSSCLFTRCQPLYANCCSVLLHFSRLYQVVLVVKNPSASAGDTGSIHGLGRSPGGGKSYLLQYSCLERPMDRGVWQATVHRVSKIWTRLKQLSMHACTVRFRMFSLFFMFCFLCVICVKSIINLFQSSTV